MTFLNIIWPTVGADLSRPAPIYRPSLDFSAIQMKKLNSIIVHLKEMNSGETLLRCHLFSYLNNRPGIARGLVDRLNRCQVFYCLFQAERKLLTIADTCREMLYLEAKLINRRETLVNCLPF